MDVFDPDLAAVRRANPELEDEQGPRAHLLPLDGLEDLLGPGGWSREAAPLAALDRVVDALCGAPSDDLKMWERLSPVAASPRDLQLYTFDASAQLLAAALHAGFFVFASEFSFPGRPLEQRGVINLEVCSCMQAASL